MRLDTERSMNRHIMITGESGAGKSNAAKLILKRLSEQGANFVVLDPHSEYVESAKDMRAQAYDASMHTINAFDLGGLTERERSSEITAMLRRILHLGDVQANVLYRCVEYTYWINGVKGTRPSMRSLIFSIKRFKANARNRPEANTLEALEKRLLAMSGDDFGRDVPMDRIMHGRSIFSLAGLHSAEAQSVYMESMLRKIYQNALVEGPGGRKRFFIAIDEAGKLQDSPVVARLVAEGRKYNIGLIAISQRAKALDREVRSNAATIIAFSQREPEEQNYVANMIAGGTEYNRLAEVRMAMRELPRGWALVQDAWDRRPKIVRCYRFIARTRDPSGRIMEMAKGAASKKELIEGLGKEGFSAEETVRAIAELVGSRRLEYHVVTERPYQGAWYISMPRNSAEHDISVRLISRYLSEHGVANKVYNNSYGPDVIAYSNGKRIAIEYETGSKSRGSTERMLAERSRKFDSVLILGKSGSSAEKA